MLPCSEMNANQTPERATDCSLLSCGYDTVLHQAHIWFSSVLHMDSSVFATIYRLTLLTHPVTSCYRMTSPQIFGG